MRNPIPAATRLSAPWPRGNPSSTGGRGKTLYVRRSGRHVPSSRKRRDRGSHMIGRVAEIVNHLTPSERPALIVDISQSLGTLGQAAVSEPLKPAVSIRPSVGAETLTCLDCGFRGKMMRRYLATRHPMTTAKYRTRWGLARDYPMRAPNYSARRAELARATGLGHLRKARGLAVAKR